MERPPKVDLMNLHLRFSTSISAANPSWSRHRWPTSGLAKDLKGMANLTGGITPVYATWDSRGGEVGRGQYSLAIVYPGAARQRGLSADTHARHTARIASGMPPPSDRPVSSAYPARRTDIRPAPVRSLRNCV